MSAWLVVAFAVFILFAVVVTVFVLRRPAPLPPPDLPPVTDEDPDALVTRHQMLDERGSELIERRIELDARRGTLGGNSQLYAELEELEQRLRSGEISEREYEAEKIHLLGG
jgi:hypothetical protein